MPQFFSDGATKEELLDDEKRLAITEQLVSFMRENMELDIDDEGYITIETED